MKTSALLSLILCASLSFSVAHASDIQKEIEQEATLAMTPIAPKPAAKLIHLEPIGGITFSKLKGSVTPGYNFETNTGYEGGIGVIIGRGKFQFETGFMYAERSSKETYRNGIQSWDLTYQNKYLELPLLARYNVIDNNDMRLYVKAGGIGSMLQDSTGTLSNMQNYSAYNAGMNGVYNPYTPYYGGYGAYSSNLINDNSTKSAFATTDFRWVVGIGGQLRVTKNLAVLMEGDYQNSINTISNNQPNGYIGSTNMNLTLETYGIKAGVLISM